jgi:hypothetical protein
LFPTVDLLRLSLWIEVAWNFLLAFHGCFPPAERGDELVIGYTATEPRSLKWIACLRCSSVMEAP